MQIILFDTHARQHFLPLTATRSFTDVYLGFFTMHQWWEKITGQKVNVHTVPYLQEKYAITPQDDIYLYINAHIMPSKELWNNLNSIPVETQVLNTLGDIIAFKAKHPVDIKNICIDKTKTITRENVLYIRYPHELVDNNALFFQQQQKFLTTSHHPISASNTLIHPQNIFIEENVYMEGCIINAHDGPVYISKNCTVMEGSLIRGPFFAGEGSVIKMGTKIYGATTIGKKCTIGGEIKNIIMHDGSNKAHDGYLGDSIIGAWCNFGAGSSGSNIKNTAGKILIKNVSPHTGVQAGLKFGTIVGDYTRFSINTSLNAGSSVGVCCSLHNQKTVASFVPHFSWSSSADDCSYTIDKAIQHIQRWMALKKETMSMVEEKILRTLWNMQYAPDTNIDAS